MSVRLKDNGRLSGLGLPLRPPACYPVASASSGGWVLTLAWRLCAACRYAGIECQPAPRSSVASSSSSSPSHPQPPAAVDPLALCYTGLIRGIETLRIIEQLDADKAWFLQ